MQKPIINDELNHDLDKKHKELSWNGLNVNFWFKICHKITL